MNARQVLGVGPMASPDEIRAAYRRHAARLHPDRNPDPKAAEQFREVTKAYEVLSSGGSPFGAMPASASSREAKTAIDAVASMVDSFFSGILGAAAPGRAAGLSDIRVELRVTRRQAALGAALEIEVPSREPCASCEGTGLGPEKQCPSCMGKGAAAIGPLLLGLIGITVSCQTCSGTGHRPCAPCLGIGLVPVVRKVTVRVPAGLGDGLRLRFSGQGDLDPRSGFRGDLLCDVRLMP